MTGPGPRRRPGFLILGSPKCGTTALARLLDAHPDVAMSTPKEPHFFDAHYERGFEHYADWPAHGIAGEATPSYLLVPYVADRIKADLPDAKLIAILRHPVERAFSSWWMFHARGMEPLDFNEAIAENERTLTEDIDEDAWRKHVAALERGDRIPIRTYLETGHYARHLQRYFRHFPRDRTEVVFSEELAADPEAVVKRLWRFIGVSGDAPLPEQSRENEALGARARPFMDFLRATGLMRLRGMVPERLKAVVKRRLSSMGPRPEMRPEDRRRLCTYFAPHVRELEELLEVELPGWYR